MIFEKMSLFRTGQFRFAIVIAAIMASWTMSSYVLSMSSQNESLERKIVVPLTVNDSFHTEANSVKDTMDAGTIANRLKPKLVNINSADAEELMKLPGIGRILAERVIEYRGKNGKFKNVDELLKVKGLGAKKLAKCRELVTLE